MIPFFIMCVWKEGGGRREAGGGKNEPFCHSYYDYNYKLLSLIIIKGMRILTMVIIMTIKK